MTFSRSARSLKRQEPQFKQLPSVLLICEDSKSSKSYFEDVKQHFRVILHVNHCGHTDPLGIVNNAIRNIKKYDNIFCVIDRDLHANFDEALIAAQAHPKIKLIVSYPCFEFWLKIHFFRCTKPYVASGAKSPADCLISDLTKIDIFANYEKSGAVNLFAALLGAPFETAKKYSPSILADAQAIKELNPSTEIHKLIKFIEELSTPQPIPTLEA